MVEFAVPALGHWHAMFGEDRRVTLARPMPKGLGPRGAGGVPLIDTDRAIGKCKIGNRLGGAGRRDDHHNSTQSICQLIRCPLNHALDQPVRHPSFGK